MKDDMNEKKIKDEDLESVSGGYIFDATKIDRSPETFRKRWEVIDDITGDVRGAFDRLGKAEEAADDLGLSKDKIDLVFLNKLRGNNRRSKDFE